jgi:hypothetical protein
VNDVYRELNDGVIIEKIVQLISTKVSLGSRSRKGSLESILISQLIIVPSLDEQKMTKFTHFRKDLMASTGSSEMSPAFKLARQRETLSKAFAKMKELGITVGNIAVEGL